MVRAASKRYKATNSVRSDIDKYNRDHPEAHGVACKMYRQNHPEKNKKTKEQSKTPTAEYSGIQLITVKIFSLTNSSLLSRLSTYVNSVRPDYSSKRLDVRSGVVVMAIILSLNYQRSN